MIVPDLNLLLYAHDSKSPFFERARQWWAECLNGKEAVGLTHPVVLAFSRISTMTSVISQPLSLNEAADEVGAWIGRRVVVTSSLLDPDSRRRRRGGCGQVGIEARPMAETSRELCYRLYVPSERRKWNLEARSYNGLVQSWPEIMRLARENEAPEQMAFEDLEE